MQTQLAMVSEIGNLVYQVTLIAQKFGYEAEAAFSKAFKRCLGKSLGDYRRLSNDN